MKVVLIIPAIAIWIIMMFVISDTQITLKPFSFKVLYPARGIGWSLIIIGISFIDFSSRRKAMDEVCKEVEEIQSKARMNLEAAKELARKNEAIVKTNAMIVNENLKRNGSN